MYIFYGSSYWYKISFDHVGFICPDPNYGIRRTNPGNGAFVAIIAQVVPDLQMEGSVPEGGAPLHTFRTTDAEVFIDDVFKIGVFDKFSLYGRCGTELVFGTRFQPGHSWFEIPAAEVAISAQVVCMHAFYSGRIFHAIGGASPALAALEGIDLPYPFFRGGPGCCQGSDTGNRDPQGDSHSLLYEIPSVECLILCHCFCIYRIPEGCICLTFYIPGTENLLSIPHFLLSFLLLQRSQSSGRRLPGCRSVSRYL